MTFGDFLSRWESLILSFGGSSPRVGAPMASLLPWVPKRVAIVAPHPDDECFMAGAALRLKAETNAAVFVIPFSYGSLSSRREARKLELLRSLEVLGFELLDPRASGDEELGEEDVEKALRAIHPDAVIGPHDTDGHSAHIRCSRVTRRAVERQAAGVGAPLLLLESEYWHPLRDPNLRVPLGLETVSKMGEALMRHAGEVSRNPYHLSLPAWLMDQERRGAEILAGHGSSPAEKSLFSQLYRVSRISPEGGS